MGKFLRVLGAGILSGFGYVIGSKLAQDMFPNGINDFVQKQRQRMKAKRFSWSCAHNAHEENEGSY